MCDKEVELSFINIDTNKFRQTLVCISVLRHGGQKSCDET